MTSSKRDPNLKPEVGNVQLHAEPLYACVATTGTTSDRFIVQWLGYLHQRHHAVNDPECTDSNLTTGKKQSYLLEKRNDFEYALEENEQDSVKAGEVDIWTAGQREAQQERIRYFMEVEDFELEVETA
ncbi:hypothetical protein BGZ94_008916 [Podila epigama]|nr:hypothetical protein BGZ94_008916 [Podila epigama]